jgi:hypothetical protein
MAESQSWPPGPRPVETKRTHDVGKTIPPKMDGRHIPEVSSQKRGVIHK